MKPRAYHRLTISARDSHTKVTVCDMEGHFICSGMGTVNVSLIRGRYLYGYGRDGRSRPVYLDDDMNIEQAAKSDAPEVVRESVDGTAYVSPSRVCITEGCADRMQWDRESHFVCDTCGQKEEVADNEEILLKELLLQMDKEKEDEQ
jgi:hypothetical protein